MHPSSPKPASGSATDSLAISSEYTATQAFITLRGGIENKISWLGPDFTKLKDRRYEGWFAGAGISYGYAVILGKHWNMEFEIGGGYAYFVSDVYECEKCGSKLEDDVPHHYFGVTKAAINLVYVF